MTKSQPYRSKLLEFKITGLHWNLLDFTGIHEFQYAGKNFTVLCCKAVIVKVWASSLLTPPIENIRMTVLLIKRLNLNWYLTNSLKVGFILNMLTTGAEFYRSILIIFQNNYVEQITNPRPTNKLQ